MSLVVKTAPANEPISLAEAKAHLRVGIVDDDDVIQNCIRTARWNLERTYRRAFLPQTLVYGLDYFGQPEYTFDIFWPISWWPPSGYSYPLAAALDLPRAPAISINTVTYTDPAGNPQTLSATNYTLDADSEPARLAPSIGHVWPVTAVVPGAVKIEFVAGYPDAKSIPDDQKQAMKLLIGDLYENREQTQIGSRLMVVELPRGVKDLMAPVTRYLIR